MTCLAPSATAEDWAALQAEWAAVDGLLAAIPRYQEPPSVEDLYGPSPDPESAAQVWPDEVPEPRWVEDWLAAGQPGPGPEPIKAGYWDRASGRGAGFAGGGAADTLEPGPALAGLADRAWAGGLRRLSEDELIGVMRAGRRLTSWAAALELAATGDLVRRRLAEEQAGDSGAAEHTGAEIAAALRLTTRAAARQLELAWMLATLPLTCRALAAGQIDLPKAAVIADETSSLGPAHRAAVEQRVLGRAPGQTRTELRASVRRAVITADPAAVRRRQEQAQRDARVERWAEDAGTASLAGRDLPPAEVLAADHHLSALARGLQRAGVKGTMDQLRAKVFLALLAGQEPQSLLPGADGTHAADGKGSARPTSPANQPAQRPGTSDGMGGAGAADGMGRAAPADPAPADPAPADPAPADRAAGAGLSGPGPVGAINLTMPLSTWLGLSQTPGDVAGYGPLDATDSRDLATRLATNPATRWCLTLTDSHGHPIAHGCTRTPPPHRTTSRSRPPPSTGAPTLASHARAWLPVISLQWLETGACTHQRQSRSYRPSPSLQHLIHIRQRTCAYPGCQRPAERCDQEHTTPFHMGGRTCECNLAPICRAHHKAKQSRRWHLAQTQPGFMTWRTPSGRIYTTHPTQYPV